MPRRKVHPCNILAASDYERLAMTISNPIPIPPSQVDDPHFNDDVTHTKKYYDAATWRMYELITAARLRAAAKFYYTVDDPLQRLAVFTQDQDNHNATVNTPTPDDTTLRGRPHSLRERPSGSSPISSSPLDGGVFIMD